MPAPTFTLRELGAACGALVEGEGATRIRQIGTLHAASAGTISFLANPKYRHLLATTQASAVILAPEDAVHTTLPRLVTEQPYACYARVAGLLNPPRAFAPGVAPDATVGEGARIAASATLSAGVHVGAGSVVGERVVLLPGAVIGERVFLGDDTRVFSNAVVYDDCVIGSRCIIHAGAVIGADGFGMAEDQGVWIKIPQLGRVVLGADVEVGANTTIDRGALDDTVLEDGVKLDNQIQIAHNCRIGAHTAIAGCVGIAGSTRIGRHCKIGGAAMIIGHLAIADEVVISAGSFVSKSITRPGVYTGVYPLAPHEKWLRSAPHIRQLEELADRVRELEKRLKRSEGS
jgi:UDP-3-O-[3-hydroxymyristoyl] glucosamine N-acyltransferase